VTLKLELGVTQGILLMFHSSHRPISYSFRDK